MTYNALLLDIVVDGKDTVILVPRIAAVRIDSEFVKWLIASKTLFELIKDLKVAHAVLCHLAFAAGEVFWFGDEEPSTDSEIDDLVDKLNGDSYRFVESRLDDYGEERECDVIYQLEVSASGVRWTGFIDDSECHVATHTVPWTALEDVLAET